MASIQRLAQLSAAKQLDLSSDFVPIYSISQPTHYAGHSTGRCSMTARGALLLSPKDNVATMLEDAPPGSEVPARLGNEVRLVKALEKVPFGFKIAVLDIAQGAGIVKYGEAIGIASQDIKTGEMVHIHNLAGARGRGDLAKGDAK
jgi:altronate dehydratase small subunit